MIWASKQRRSIWALVLLVVIGAGGAAHAAIFGAEEFGYVLIVDDVFDDTSSTDDHIDYFNTYNNALTNSGVAFTSSAGDGSTAGSGQKIRAITASNTRGILYAVGEAGELWRVDWYGGTSTQVATLTVSGDDTTFDSITNMPGRDQLYVLRTGPGVGVVDVFDLNTQVQTHNVFTTVGGGDISISHGPAYNSGPVNTGTDPALYMIATGGNFEVWDPDTPGTSTVVSNGRGGAGTGSFVSITHMPGNDAAVYILDDRQNGDNTDRIHRFNIDGTRNENLVATGGTGASSITYSPRPGWTFNVATGGAYTHAPVEPSATGAQLDASAGAVRLGATGAGTSEYHTVAAVDPTPVYEFVYIADDGNANHTDLFDSNYHDTRGFANNVFANSATATGTPTSGTDYRNTSVTDGFDPWSGGTKVYQLHTGGELYSVDVHTGHTKLVADLDPTDTAGTFDNVTNLPGDNRLFILRSDRPLNQKTGGSNKDFVDVVDLSLAPGDPGFYQAGLWQTQNTGFHALTDGPSFAAHNASFGDKAIYLLASGGAFEVIDPDQPGLLQVISTGVPGSNGDYVDITNLPGHGDHLFALRDASTGQDVVDALGLDGVTLADIAGAITNMGGAISITDTAQGELFATATGAASAIIHVNLSDLAASSFTAFTLTSGTYASVTNIEQATGTLVPTPTALAMLPVLSVFAFRRR